MSDEDLIRRGDALAIFQPENSMIRRRICDDIRALPAQVQPAPVAVDADHEEIGKAIWAAMLWAAKSKKLPNGMTYPEWSDDPDSQARKECTKAAARILSALDARPVAEVQAPLEAENAALTAKLEAAEALVERAFKDGMSYANNVNVLDPAEQQKAWEWSQVRADLAKIGGGNG